MLTAIVTGASRGLGKEIARILREKGWNVVAPSRYELDLGSEESIVLFSRRCPGVDLLINNAAVMSDDMERSVRINAMGPYRLTKELWPLLAETKGHVVNVSSREGLMQDNLFGRRPYSASKALLNAITRTMADNKDGVTVNACCPGWFRSRLGGDKAPISATEAADTPIWLVTQEHSFNGKFFIDRKEVAW